MVGPPVFLTIEADYLRHGGILPYVLRELPAGAAA